MDGDVYGVLIVEDDPLVADALEAGVAVAGYGVCGTASDADSAVEKMALHRPQLAIIDIDLGGDGVEAARRMLARPTASQPLHRRQRRARRRGRLRLRPP